MKCGGAAAAGAENNGEVVCLVRVHRFFSLFRRVSSATPRVCVYVICGNGVVIKIEEFVWYRRENCGRTDLKLKLRQKEPFFGV